MIGEVAAEAWSLTSRFDREVAMLSLVRSGRPRLLAALAIGERDRVEARPEAIFRLGFSEFTDGLILAHNHVDDLPPSSADNAVTRRLVAAGAVVGLPLLAHVVVTKSGWYDCVAGSFARW